MINRREKIREYIRNKTIQLIKDEKINDNGIEAEDISYDLKIDRANVSRELNSLWKNGELIKIAGRPVFYLDSKVISNTFPESYIPTFIPKEEHLSDYINSANTYQSPYDNHLDLSNMIGSDGSLVEVIRKAKAAIAYPPYGLHTLITGNSGTEKSTLADSMVEYAIKSGFKNKRCPYFDIDCRRANANITQFEEKLFGIQDEYNKENSHKGILEMCTNGFLLLQNIDYLPQSTVDLISSLLNKGYFTRMNSSTQIPVRFMMILISSRKLSDPKLLPFTHYITTNIALPDMDDRGVYEKLVMIMDCFAREARNIKKAIRVSKEVIFSYAVKIYTENITKLENEIRDACSQAYSDNISKDTHFIDITLSDLPKEVTDYDRPALTNKDAERLAPMMLDIIYNDHIYFDSNGHSEEFDFFEHFSHNTASSFKDQFMNDYFDPTALKDINQVVDQSIGIIKNSNSQQLSQLGLSVEPEIRTMVNSILFHNSAFFFLQENQEYLYGLYMHIASILSGHAIDLSSFQIEDQDPSSPEYKVAASIANQMKDRHDIELSENDKAFISAYLKRIRESLTRGKVSIVVAVHGESIASQMVDYVKKTSDSKVNIEALDYPYDMSFETFLDKATETIRRIDEKAGVLILADYEPLTELGSYISKLTGIPCKTLAPITMHRLIDLSEKSTYSINTLNDLSSSGLKNSIADFQGEEEFITELVEKKIIPICQFIDPYKAITILQHCLKNIFGKLGADYSDVIATDYYLQAIPMLERVIRSEPLQNKKLYRFISTNNQLMQTITQSLEPVNHAYSVRIPPAEVAAIAKLFLPLTKNK